MQFHARMSHSFFHPVSLLRMLNKSIEESDLQQKIFQEQERSFGSIFSTASITSGSAGYSQALSKRSCRKVMILHKREKALTIHLSF